MDIKKQIDRAYRVQTASMLRLSLYEFSAIDLYDKGVYQIPNKRNDLFEELVSRIVTEYTSQNDINEDYIEQQFGCDGTEECRTLQCLLYYEAGKRLSKREDLTLKDLAKLYDNVYGSLFYGLSLGYDQTSALIDNLSADFENEVLLRSRFYHSTGEKALKEIYDIYKADATIDSIIKRIDVYNDGAYTELPLAVDAISYICQLQGYEELWLKLFDTLRYFPLQGAMLHQIRTIDGYITLLKHESGRENSKIVSKIALDKFLRMLSDIPEQLLRNRDSKVLNDEQHFHSAKLLEIWNAEYEDRVSVVAELLIDSLGVVDFVSWLSQEMRCVEGMNPQYVEYQRQALQVMRVVADRYTSKNEQDLTDCNFDSLLYYANLAGGYSKEYCVRLANEICRRAYTDRWVQSIPLTDDGFTKLRSLCNLLSRAEVDGMELMRKYRKTDEGYSVDPKASTNIHYGDNFWLPILVLQHENGTEELAFKKLMQYLFRLVNRSSSVSFDDYFTSFYLAELIVTQIMPDLQNVFESDLIHNVSDLVFVLRVLTGNEGKMSDDIVKMLKARINSEWKYEKKLYHKRDKDQIKFLDEFISKL